MKNFLNRLAQKINSIYIELKRMTGANNNTSTVIANSVSAASDLPIEPDNIVPETQANHNASSHKLFLQFSMSDFSDNFTDDTSSLKFDPDMSELSTSDEVWMKKNINSVTKRFHFFTEEQNYSINNPTENKSKNRMIKSSI